MKKFLLIGFLLMSATAFSQVGLTESLTKDQEKQVKNIQKKTENDLSSIVKNDKAPADGRKSQVLALKDVRKGQLESTLTAGQVSSVLANDPIKWDDALKKIDEQYAKLKKQTAKEEMNKKLDELDKQKKDLSVKQDDLKQQMDDLKKKQSDIGEQQKTLKQAEKDVKKQYNQ